MTDTKDQGRYARMISFWGIVLLVAYGCLHGGGLVTVLDGWLGQSNTTFVEPFPLLGALKTSTLIGLALIGLTMWIVHRVLSKPRIATALVETEGEMYKVTWPKWAETWTGTVAVVGTVLVLFVFLTAVDLLLTEILGSVWGNG